ncbi:HlyD family type I secretion periplasmic adaptor subunit [Roseovarius nubinhibens]|uniref:Membrane fusion protein (MFP) family protein n=1 Tax=Roseovarius nubinhibens (strain ATCC BAA-591 / DSM 15170 / ISM) TaxID=89187 RepID=A3SM41_ROSNI|nr:HlyD family type I secretion periplasmic adaptor subunit [Roseovarius nubinhibens]EAP78422.1 RTX secretion protein D, HlyD family protein [Roseovarius nubinhibens ISM]
MKQERSWDGTALAEEPEAEASEDLGWLMRLGWLALLILCLGFGGWAFAARLSQAVVAPGWVVRDMAAHVVQHPDGGTLAALAVRPGMQVAKGALLARFEGGEIAEELILVEARLFEVMARRARLEAERDGAAAIDFDPELRNRAAGDEGLAETLQGQGRLFATRRAAQAREAGQARRRVAQSRAEIDGLGAQARALRRQAGLIAQELTDLRQLRAQGLTPAGRVLALEREAARLDGELGEVAAHRAGAEGRIAEIELEQLGRESRMRERVIDQLRDLRHREIELAETRRVLRARFARLELRAPVAGTIQQVEVHGPGAVIRPAAPILTLVAGDRPIHVSAEISPLEVDQIYSGQAALLRFSALEQGEGRDVAAKVGSISPDVVQDGADGRRYYRAEVWAEAEALRPLQERAGLVPGMPVEVYLQTGEQSPAQFLLRPVTAYFNRAFRG